MANRFWVNGGSGQWNNTNNWSATSGGASGASVPTSADDVFFDGLGNSNCTVNASNTCRSITCSGYTSTFSVTFGTLVVTNGIEFSSGMSFAGNNAISLSGGSLRTNGVTLRNFQFASSGTITLLDDCTVSNLTINPVTPMTLNGFAINAIGALTFSAANQTIPTLGTTVLNINGTGNQTITTNNGTLGLAVNINKASGTLNIPNFNVGYGCVLTYITGTVVHTGALQTLGSITLNTSGVSWNGWNIANATTHNITFTSTFTMTGQLLFNNTVVSTTNFIGAGFFTSCGSIAYNSQNITTVNLVNDITTTNFSTAGDTSVKTLNNHNIFINGNMTIGTSITGNATLIMSGTGIWSGAAGILAIDLVFNTSGTITVSGTVTFNGSNKTMTYTAGTMITTGGILRLGTNCNLNLSGMIWDSIITYTSNPVYTLTSNLRANSFATTVNGSVTFNGNIFYLNSLNLSLTVTSVFGGTTQFILDGTGTITGGFTTGRITLPLIINTSGIITLSGTINVGNLTYTSGTILPTTSTVGILGTITSNNTGLNFNILQIQGNSNFTGTNGWITNTLISATGTHTYKAGNTYVINNLLQLIGTALVRITMLSNTPSSRANFNLNPSASQTVGYVTATDIDSSGGQTIWDWQGVLSNTVNWNELTPLPTVGYTFWD